MKTNKKLLSLIALSLLLAKPYNVFAASADSFRTDEYYGMDADPISAQANKNGALDIINAAAAYAKGYTGKGVTVGVTDVGIVNFSHTEFSGKTGSGVVFDGLESTEVPLTWAELMHPTHVAGIAAADKNGFGMHGVAYDADIASSSTIKHYYGGGRFKSGSSFYDNYLTNPDIKIINNSWGDYNNYLSNVQNEEDFNEIIEYLQSDIASFEIEKAVNNDKLLVFSAGNDGKLAAALENNLDVLTSDKAFNDNIITVTAAKANSFTKNQNGGFDVKSDAIAIFSNLAMYNEDTTLSAPGWNINSAYADFDASGKYYKDDSGTSMAAPMVTGAGALVQQAFPYLSGKQIGDVLLSTANDNITNDSGYFINYRWEDDENEQLNDYYNILLTGNGSDLENIGWEKLYDYFKNNKETTINYFFGGYESDWEKFFGKNGEIKSAYQFKEKYKDILKAVANINVYQNVPLDVIFGQGIVDAGKAVNGLGAINVRRLDKSDISSVNGKTKQALYTVDTQGYNSTWSNSIGEIRAGYIAENPLTGKSSVDDTDNSGYDENSNDFNEKFAGLTDLHDRWVFYTTNNFDDNPVDSEDYNWMVNHYIQQYNKQVAASGLARLHAGLYKTGEGILALAGDNTYKGASIAAGGTLQIDGSVAGDAYSKGAGTIAGSGTINGDLYNNGVVEAGSWGAVFDEETNKPMQLSVGGDFTGDGVIAVNTDGTNYAQIAVTGDADVSGMSLKAGTFAAPDIQGTILTVDETTGFLKGAENLNGSFSGMLNSEVEVSENNTLKLTTSVSNNAGIDGARFNAFNSLYNNLTKAEQQEMQRLYALNSGSLNNAVNELSQSESMHMELARDAIQNRDVRQAVARQQHLDRDEGLWVITGKNWGETDGGITRHSYNLTLGKDFYNTDNTYAGALFAYSDNSIGGNNADGEYKNYSLGIYGGSKNSPGTVTGYVSYGVQDNELNRHLGSAFSHSGMGSKLESDYDSSVIGVGAKYAYDLHYGKEGWHVSPYAAFDYAHYKQDSFTESGSVFDVHSGGFSDNYLTGELGFDFNREEDNGKYGFSLAYKRILDGDTLDADFAFAKGGNGFGVQSIDGSKNHIVASAYISTKLSDKWEIGGTLLHDWSSTDRDLSAAVNLNYYF